MQRKITEEKEALPKHWLPDCYVLEMWIPVVHYSTVFRGKLTGPAITAKVHKLIMFPALLHVLSSIFPWKLCFGGEFCCLYFFIYFKLLLLYKLICINVCCGCIFAVFVFREYNLKAIFIILGLLIIVSYAIFVIS